MKLKKFGLISFSKDIISALKLSSGASSNKAVLYKYSWLFKVGQTQTLGTEYSCRDVRYLQKYSNESTLSLREML
jgi:hypothetical protein